MFRVSTVIDSVETCSTSALGQKMALRREESSLLEEC